VDLVGPASIVLCAQERLLELEGNLTVGGNNFPAEGHLMTVDSPEAYEKHNDDADKLEQRIRERAYRLWEVEGRCEGRENEYWNRAEELIKDETKSAYPPSASRGNRT
jgi:hypothetical protein